FFNVEVVTTKSIELKTSAAVNGYIKTGYAVTLTTGMTFTSMSLLAQTAFSTVPTGYTQLIITNGSITQHWLTTETTCIFKAADFENDNVCKYIVNYIRIDVVLPTVMISDVDRTFKSIKNMEGFVSTPLNQPNLKVETFTIAADYTGTSAIIKEAKDVILSNSYTLTITTVTGTVSVNSLGCYLFATSVNTLAYQPNNMYIVGKIADKTGTAINGETLYRYNKANTDCSTKVDGTFEEYDCNSNVEGKIPDFANLMTMVVKTSISAITKQFSACKIDTSALTISNIKCTTTSISVQQFTIQTSQLGTLTLTNEVDDAVRIIEGSTISDLSQQSTTTKPIFYASTMNTISNANPKLKVVRITSNHYRYYGKGNGDNKCEYSSTGYSIVDCNTAYATGIELTISANDFDNSQYTYMNVITTTAVSSITTLKATSFGPVFTDSLTIGALNVATMTLPTIYNALVINSSPTLQSAITGSVSGGKNPLFVGVVTVPESIKSVELSGTMNRYYTGTLGLDCNCASATAFTEWDCTNTYYLNKKIFKCTNTNVASFTFPITANEFDTVEITHTMTISSIEAKTLKINTGSYVLQGAVTDIIVGAKHIDGTYSGTFTTLNVNDTSFNVDIMHYKKGTEELPTLTDPMKLYQISEGLYRISTSDGYYCTYSGKGSDNSATYLEGDCVNSTPDQILKIDSSVTAPTADVVFASTATPRTFATVKTAYTTLILNNVKLTTLIGTELTGKMDYTIGEVATFLPKTDLVFNLNSKVGTVIIGYQVTDGVIQGSVDKIGTSFATTHLFVLKTTTTPTAITSYTTQIDTGVYRVSSTTDIANKNFCTAASKLNLFEEFDCNLYAKDGTNQLKLYSNNVVVDLTSYHIKSFM
ncbi:hypothetical protein EIN_400860, partial [Entamoeba invadens IP1]